MIIVGGKNYGKRLVRKMAEEIAEQGYTEVAALSVKAIEKLNNAGQNLSNASGFKVEATPEEREIEVSEGHYKHALVVRMELVGYEKGEK